LTPLVFANPLRFLRRRLAHAANPARMPNVQGKPVEIEHRARDGKMRFTC